MTDEKPVLIVFPTWDSDEPRFVVKECTRCGNDRQFKNGKCVYNQRLGFCYSVDEIVEVLNNQGEENEQLKKENQRLKEQNNKLRKVSEYYDGIVGGFKIGDL